MTTRQLKITFLAMLCLVSALAPFLVWGIFQNLAHIQGH